MGGQVLGVDQFAVEHGQGVGERGRSAGDGLPLAQRKAFFGGQAGNARKRGRKLLVVGGKRVQREIAILHEQFVVGILAVEANQDHGRRV